MKDPKKKRDVRIEFVVSEQEAELIQEHKAFAYLLQQLKPIYPPCQ